MTAYDESGMGVSEYEARKESSSKDAHIAELTAEVEALRNMLAVRMEGLELSLTELGKCRDANSKLITERDKYRAALDNVHLEICKAPVFKLPGYATAALIIARNALKGMG